MNSSHKDNLFSYFYEQKLLNKVKMFLMYGNIYKITFIALYSTYHFLK